MDYEMIDARIGDLIKKGKSIIATAHHHEETEHWIGALFEGKVNIPRFNQWRTETLFFLENIFGRESSYFEEFEKVCYDNRAQNVELGIAVLESIKNELDFQKRYKSKLK